MSTDTPTPTLLGTTELVDTIARRANLHRPVVRAVLDHLEQTLIAALREDRRVRIPGLGVFGAKHTPARTGTSPARPGHPARDWSRPAGLRVHFRPATTLTAALATPEATNV